MSFLPVVNSSTGNVEIGESNKALTMVGNTPFLATAKWQTYTQTGTFSSSTWYNATPFNFLTPYIPFLVVGYLDLNSAPWYLRYSLLYTNLQQNGDSQNATRVGGFSHSSGLFWCFVGNQTSYYGDGVSTLRVLFSTTVGGFTSTGSLRHDFYRLGT